MTFAKPGQIYLGWPGFFGNFWPKSTFSLIKIDILPMGTFFPGQEPTSNQENVFFCLSKSCLKQWVKRKIQHCLKTGMACTFWQSMAQINIFTCKNLYITHKRLFFKVRNPAQIRETCFGPIKIMSKTVGQKENPTLPLVETFLQKITFVHTCGALT